MNYFLRFFVLFAVINLLFNNSIREALNDAFFFSNFYWDRYIYSLQAYMIDAKKGLGLQIASLTSFILPHFPVLSYPTYISFSFAYSLFSFTLL